MPSDDDEDSSDVDQSTWTRANSVSPTTRNNNHSSDTNGGNNGAAGGGGGGGGGGGWNMVQNMVSKLHTCSTYPVTQSALILFLKYFLFS